MPSPRLSGSGMWKILPLPHGLEDQVLHLIAFLPHSLQPLIGAFFCSGFLGVCVGGPRFASLSWGGGLSSLETVMSKVSELLTVETLYSPHVPLLPLFPNVPFLWGEGWHGCLVSLIWFWAAIIFCFGHIGPPSVSRGVHGIWIAPLV